jgi:hypothetical protein
LVFSRPDARQRLLATPLAESVLVLTQAQAGRLAGLPMTVQTHLATAAARLVLVPGKLTASVAGEQALRPRLEVRAAAWPAVTRTVRLRLDAHLEPAYRTQNVVGYLPGTARPDSFVVVSAHYDHLGIIGGQVYNGADDDGSGTTGMLAIAEAFTKAAHAGHGPRRSILFLANTGEEKGLLGSQYYTDHPVFPLANTVTDLNIDMIGRTDEAHEGKPDYVYVIGSDKLSSQLHAVLEKANQQHGNIALDRLQRIIRCGRGQLAKHHGYAPQRQAGPLKGDDSIVEIGGF